MGTNCAPLVADLFLFCYEREFMMSLSHDKQADVIDALNTTVVPRPLSNDPRFTQCIYRYSRASKRFVEVYIQIFGRYFKY